MLSDISLGDHPTESSISLFPGRRDSSDVL